MAHRHRILVVDDESAIRDLFRDILADGGNEVEVAANGEQALERLRAGDPPCVVLMDLLMPRMSGWQLAAHIHRDPSLTRIPLAVIAANPRHAADMVRIGAQAWLGKPVDLDRLYATVDRLCREGSIRRPEAAHRAPRVGV